MLESRRVEQKARRWWTWLEGRLSIEAGGRTTLDGFS